MALECQVTQLHVYMYFFNCELVPSSHFNALPLILQLTQAYEYMKFKWSVPYFLYLPVYL